MSTIKRTSRESEKKVLKEAKKPWTPPSSLDAPPAPNGYAHRWIRTNVQGFEDTANVSKKLREGWEFVKTDQIIEEIGQHNYPFYTEGRYKGCIGIGGLVLARIPEETLISRAEYFDKITQDRMNAVDNDLMKEQHPDMPINIDRQSRVTFGGGRKK
tara:strand:+ start:135 stop:605 length:471 start_codon:yes stop_codon:yes gene_type:complete